LPPPLFFFRLLNPHSSFQDKNLDREPKVIPRDFYPPQIRRTFFLRKDLSAGIGFGSYFAIQSQLPLFLDTLFFPFFPLQIRRLAHKRRFSISPFTFLLLQVQSERASRLFFPHDEESFFSSPVSDF